MAKTKILTIPQYKQQVKKVSRQAILKAIHKNKLHLLPNVVSITKPGRDYFLEVSV